ncbi:sigma-70 family RNA polymerase sigma factor [Candidatus Poribacteria bacterium]|nr:sigma-70 family RNA polymerase sigma factor [Candidatus Poribacteria bacterium]
MQEFELVALKHIDSLHRTALYMSGNEDDALDLVQDTYLRAYRFFDKFQTGTNCKAWLLTILRNTFMNSIRRKKRKLQTIHLSEMEEYGSEISDESTPEDDLLKDKFDDDLTAAIESLPAVYKKVVLMSDLQGLSYKEIADSVGCPIGTVMSRLSRGRGLLRKRLKKYAVQNGYI